MLAGAAWLGLIRAARTGQLDVSSSTARRLLIALVVAACALRAVALGLPPAFSEDVFRYVYEGRVVWHYGWSFPFAHPPADAPTLGVDPALIDHSWLRINHPELSTIYPPIAQIVFVAAGGLGELTQGGHLWWLKALLVGADLLTWVCAALVLRACGRPIGESIVWGLSPLVIIEIAREGHADSLSALGLSLGILGFCSAAPRLGYAGWAVAALAKLNGLVVMPAAARTTRRGLWLALALCTLVAVPYFFAGGTAGAGLAAYASRWRAGDGAFSVLLELSRILLGGEWTRLEALGGVTLTRHQLARGLVAAIFGGWSLALLARWAPLSAVADRAGLLLLGLLLLAPTLHPWYVLWLLPFAAAAPNFRGRSATLLLALLVPALHHPGWLELIDGQWRDVPWVRAIVHLPVWAALLAGLAAPRVSR